jgi:GT2 family glycosyltransferase
MSQIEISVIVPTYHRNDLLAKCLDCLAPNIQTFSAEQYEVIVTDDGLKTTAKEMIREYYPWVKWVEGPRKGSAANRNNGVKYARYEWIAFTDDDCLPKEDWLSNFAAAIAPDIYVYEGKTTCEAGLKSPLEQAPINLQGGWLWSCNMMVRASVFQEIGGFDENYPYPFMEDQDLRESFKKAGFKFPFVENAIVDHPPRKNQWKKNLGASKESLVYYLRIKEGQTHFKLKLVKQMVTVRLRILQKFGISKDYLKALLLMTAEILCVILHLNEWDKKYPVKNKL